MYVIIQNGEVIAECENIVHIIYGENGAYQETAQSRADGFCAKIPMEVDMEDGTTETQLFDTVFVLPGHTLRGDEPEASYLYSEEA